MNVGYGDVEEEYPHRIGGPVWLTVERLPDIESRTGYFRLTEYECVSLGKNLSFHLRAWATEKGSVKFDDEHASHLADVLKIAGKQVSRLP